MNIPLLVKLPAILRVCTSEPPPPSTTCNVPPVLISTLPFTVIVRLVPLFTVRTPPLLIVILATVTLELITGSLATLGMMTSSTAPGTVFVLQLAAMFHAVLLLPSHVIVTANAFGTGSTKHMLTAKASVTTIDDHLFQFLQIIFTRKEKCQFYFLDVGIFLPRTSSECPKELFSISSSVTRLSLY